MVFAAVAIQATRLIQIKIVMAYVLEQEPLIAMEFVMVLRFQMVQAIVARVVFLIVMECAMGRP